MDSNPGKILSELKKKVLEFGASNTTIIEEQRI